MFTTVRLGTCKANFFPRLGKCVPLIRFWICYRGAQKLSFGIRHITVPFCFRCFLKSPGLQACPQKLDKFQVFT